MYRAGVSCFSADAFEGATDGVPVQAEARGWEAEAAS